jgi:protein-disulfide isomerase
MKNKFFVIAVVILAVFVAAFVFLKRNMTESSVANQKTEQSYHHQDAEFSMVPSNQSVLLKPHSPVKGEAAAPITVVEFLDPECEACKAMYPIVKKVFEEHKADIKLVVRYMTFHKNSNYVANILEGTRAENKYWEALDLLFETQGQWADHHDPKPELIPEILKPLNLNMTKIIADAKAGKYDPQIAEDMSDGKLLGVVGTPTFFINGNVLQELGYEPLKNEIENIIGRK